MLRQNSILLRLSGLVLALSCIALLVNHWIYDFPGNNYFPPSAPLAAVLLLLIYGGTKIAFPKKSSASEYAAQLLYFFGVMALMALATNAVQLTPFPPIDRAILALEASFNIDYSALLQWMQQAPHLKKGLIWIYDSLPYQMTLLPLCLITIRRFALLETYYTYLLLTLLLGFTFYYFFPTTAPASVLPSHFFLPEQVATGFKFQQIHQHISPTTIEGGLIALPSFHCIWALLCVFLLKEWPFFCGVLFFFNLVLIASCVLLGWHYWIDILGAVLVLFVSKVLYHFLLRNRL